MLSLLFMIRRKKPPCQRFCGVSDGFSFDFGDFSKRLSGQKNPFVHFCPSQPHVCIPWAVIPFSDGWPETKNPRAVTSGRTKAPRGRWTEWIPPESWTWATARLQWVQRESFSTSPNAFRRAGIRAAPTPNSRSRNRPRAYPAFPGRKSAARSPGSSGPCLCRPL